MPGTAPRKKKILIVDDESDIVQLLKDILSDAEYEAVGATRWTDAMDVIGRGSPDLILLDLKMPTIDGPSLLEFIRSQGTHTPVIIVSGFVTDSVSEDLKRFGVSAFVHKPFKAAEIRGAVERALAGSSGPQPGSGTSAGATDLRMDDLYGPKGDDGRAAPTTDSGDKGDLLDVLEKLELGDRPDPTTDPSDAAVAPPEAELPRVRPGAAGPNVPPYPPGESERGAGFAADLLASRSSPGIGLPGAEASTDEARDRRHHHRPIRRRKTFTKRNVLLFGGMTVACFVVAAFMAVMQWYAGQVDVAELKKKSDQTLSKQAADEIIRELNQGK